MRLEDVALIDVIHNGTGGQLRKRIQIVIGTFLSGSAPESATCVRCGIRASHAAITFFGRSSKSLTNPKYPRILSAMISRGALRIPEIAETVPDSERSRSA